MSQHGKWPVNPRKEPRGMAQSFTSRLLPRAQGPVYLVLLWPDRTGNWEGRIKDAKTGAEFSFGELEELMSWLEAHKNGENRGLA